MGIYPEGNQSWRFIGRADAEAETPIPWPPKAKNWLIGKAPDAGKDWRQEKGLTEDEMISWHHQLDGHEFGQALGVGDGQGSLACWSAWGRKRVGHDWAIELNWLSQQKCIVSQLGKSSTKVSAGLVVSEACKGRLYSRTLSWPCG